MSALKDNKGKGDNKGHNSSLETRKDLLEEMTLILRRQQEGRKGRGVENFVLARRNRTFLISYSCPTSPLSLALLTQKAV